MTDEKPKNEMLEALKKMAESLPKRPPSIFDTGTLIASSYDRHYWERAREPIPAQANIVYSPFLESGKAYVIETSKLKAPPPEFMFDEKIMESVRTRIAQAFGVPSRYWGDWPEKPYIWTRKSGETLIAWGIRLDQHGLLDNPVKRWEYQKATWAALISPFRKLIARIRS